MPLVQRAFADIITFTRSTTRTYFNSSGVLSSAAINAPAIDYDPVTLACRGLSIWEARTNLLLQSGWAGATSGSPGTAPTSWSVGFGTSTVSTVTASIYGSADGATAIKFDCDSGERLFLTQTVSVTAGTTYALSAYFEAVSGSIGNGLGLVNATATGSVTQEVLNPATGRATVIYSCTGSGTVTARAGVGCLGVVGATVSATISRPQLEPASFAGPYIPTTTAQVTRAADVAVISWANFSNFYNQTEGTFVVEYTEPSAAPVVAGVIALNDNTSANQISLRSTSGTSRVFASVASVGSVNINAGALTVNTDYKVAFRFAANDFAASLNGAAVVIDTVASLPTPTQMRIGCLDTGTFFINSCIKSIVFYPTLMTNAQLVTLSTP